MEDYNYTIIYKDDGTAVLEDLARAANQTVSLIETINTSLGTMGKQVVTLFDESKTAIEGLNTAVTTSDSNTVELTKTMEERLTPTIETLAEQAEKLHQKLDVKDKVKIIGDIASETSKLIGIFGGAADSSSTFGKVLTSLSQGAAAYGSAVKIADGISKAFNITLKASPLGWIAGGIAAVTTAVGLFSSKKEEATLESNKHATKLIEEREKVNELAKELEDAETPYERRLELIAELKEINPDIVKGIDAEKVEYGKLTENVGKYNLELEKEIQHKLRLEQMNKKQSEAAEAESALRQAEYDYKNAFAGVLASIEDDDSISEERKQQLTNYLRTSDGQEEIAELAEKYSTAWRVIGRKDSHESMLTHILGRDGKRSIEPLLDEIATANINLKEAQKQDETAKQNLASQERREKQLQEEEALEQKVQILQNEAIQLFVPSLFLPTLSANNPVGIEPVQQTADDEGVQPDTVINPTKQAGDKTPNGLSPDNNSTLTGLNTSTTQNSTPQKKQNVGGTNSRTPQTLDNQKETERQNPESLPPSVIPGASDTASNVLSGGTSQRIINIHVQKFQDAVNNYFNGNKEAESKVNSFMDMMNEGWMRVLNSANQMA